LYSVALHNTVADAAQDKTADFEVGFAKKGYWIVEAQSCVCVVMLTVK
jgi:hypothetical protein